MSQHYTLYARFNRLIRTELASGEKVLWHEWSTLRFFSRYFITTYLVGVIFYLSLAPVATYGIYVLSKNIPAEHQGVCIALILFYIFGFIAYISLPLKLYLRQRKTVYILTNQRAMAIAERRKPLVNSWALKTITQIKLDEISPSIGNIRFIQGVEIIGEIPWEEIGFFHIKRANEVARLINRLIDDKEEETVDKEVVQEELSTFTKEYSQHESTLGPSGENSTLLRLLDSLPEPILFFLLIGGISGTPVILAWITNTGTVGFLFFLLLLSCYGLINPMRLQKESGQWPTVLGVVEENWVERNQGENSLTYMPHVCYQYTVGEKVYRNTSIDTPCCDSGIMSKKAAIQKTAPYTVDSNVTVYYDPKNPCISVLEAGKVDRINWLPVIILIPFIIWSGHYIYNNWTGFEAERFHIPREQIRSYLHNKV